MFIGYIVYMFICVFVTLLIGFLVSWHLCFLFLWLGCCVVGLFSCCVSVSCCLLVYAIVLGGDWLVGWLVGCVFVFLLVLTNFVFLCVVLLRYVCLLA